MRFLTLLCAVLFSSVSCLAQTGTSPGADLKHQLDEQVPAWLKEFNATSASVAYIADDKIAWTAYYGEQVPGGPPANEKTLYNVASLTKPITAEVIIRLASDKKLALDESMYAYWAKRSVSDIPIKVATSQGTRDGRSIPPTACDPTCPRKTAILPLALRATI